MKPILIILLLSISNLSFSQTVAVVNSDVIESTIEPTVLLEKRVGNTFIPHGTGFLLYSYKDNWPVLITNEHVLKNSEIFVNIPSDTSFVNYFSNVKKNDKLEIIKHLKKNNIYLGNNPKKLRLRIDLTRDTTFKTHPDSIDIAGFKLNHINGIQVNSKKITLFKTSSIPKSHYENMINLGRGDPVYFIGFPQRLGTYTGYGRQQLFKSDLPNHLVRQGIISLITEDQSEFLIDAFSYGGNSGGPVFKLGNPRKGKKGFTLIGIITGHLNMKEGNMGLATCFSINKILELVEIIEK